MTAAKSKKKPEEQAPVDGDAAAIAAGPMSAKDYGRAS
jgi:hypothetical protein